MYLKLPKNISFQDLYLEEDQTIWFLIWILKKAMPCDRYLSEILLEIPFQVVQDKYWGNPRQYILKNGQQYGRERVWYESGKLRYEQNWKNLQKNGRQRVWHENGQLRREKYWQNGQQHGPQRGWNKNGQLKYEENWENGVRI